MIPTKTVFVFISFVVLCAWQGLSYANSSLQSPVSVKTESPSLVKNASPDGNSGSDTANVTIGQSAPVVQIISPAYEYSTNKNLISVAWTVDGIPQTTQVSDSLVEGENWIRRSSADQAGNVGWDSILVMLDTKPPVVHFISPTDGTITNDTNVHLEWSIDGIQYSLDTVLTEGIHVITRTAKDEVGNVGTASITIRVDKSPPNVKSISPENGRVMNAAPFENGWMNDSEQRAQVAENISRITHK